MYWLPPITVTYFEDGGALESRFYVPANEELSFEEEEEAALIFALVSCLVFLQKKIKLWGLELKLLFPKFSGLLASWDPWHDKWEKNTQEDNNFHGVWKSQKKSHSTLRAKRTTFTS